MEPITFKRKYIDINDTLSHIRLQVLQSMKYAEENVPDFKNPEQLYRWLKNRTVYKNDPPGVELLQTMPTLINGDYWGTPGAGDCDCFSITTLACCQVLGWPTWLKLAGRSKDAPVHIWTGVRFQGEDIAMDLTEKLIGRERPYKYVQKINFSPVR